jgi:hypothetical protein
MFDTPLRVEIDLQYLPSRSGSTRTLTEQIDVLAGMTDSLILEGRIM